ncbi:MAG: ATP-dependent Clp protease ATP-binding subunit, partial [Patescibacteria group bacterium]
MSETKETRIYFDDPRLKMTLAGRMFVRVASSSAFLLLAAAGATFLISGINRLFWLGALILLFFGDWLFHRNHAERLIGEAKGGEINAADYLSLAAYKITERAFDRALLQKKNFYLLLLRQLLERKEIREGLARMDVALEEIRRKTDEYLGKTAGASASPELRASVENYMAAVFSEAKNRGSHCLEPDDLFSALSLAGDAEIAKIFNLFSINAGDLSRALIFSRFRKRFWGLSAIPATLGGFAPRVFKAKPRRMNRAWTARPTPVLDKFSVDFTDLARLETVGFLVGHEKEYARLADVLAKTGKANALLVGESGAGKETIVAHLAYQMAKDGVPPALFDKRLVSLQIGGLVAGAQPAELQERINKIIEEIKLAGNIVLYVPDVHNLVRTSGEAFLSVADVLLPAAVEGDFSVIGSTFPKEFKQFIESRGDFSDAFEIIRVEEISEDEAERLLVYHGLLWERQYGIVVSFGAVKKAVALARRYFHQKLLPASAEELLKEAVAAAAAKGEKTLNAEGVIAVAEKKVNVPLREVGKDEAQKLLKLEEIIHVELVDQEEAVKAVSRALREYRSGLSRKGGPIAVFLFVGPTGVGKTELSKILAKIQFGSKEAMARFDMSEFQDKQSVVRFIGSPDGQIAGALTEAVIAKPFSLILLDEFEKAHPDILNLFLQVFDDGRLTDGLGRTVDFQNTIVIATSNARSDFVKSAIEAGKGAGEIAEELKKKLAEYFRPELVNRFSGIVVFKNLSLADTEAIARLQLAELAKGLAATHGISLVVSEEAVKKIAALGYDPVFGARPLRG